MLLADPLRICEVLACLLYGDGIAELDGKGPSGDKRQVREAYSNMVVLVQALVHRQLSDLISFVSFVESIACSYSTAWAF